MYEIITTTTAIRVHIKCFTRGTCYNYNLYNVYTHISVDGSIFVTQPYSQNRNKRCNRGVTT